MDSFKLKILISLLGGLIFSLIFILLALVIPVNNKEEQLVLDKPKGKLAEISHAMRNR